MYFIPGVIWNICFPVILIGIALYLLLKKGKIGSRFLTLVFLFFGLMTVLEISFKAKSVFNCSSPESGKELTLLSYNVFFKNQSPKSTIDIIIECDPDILFVQELTPMWKQRLDKLNFPFRITKALNGTHGIGVYSKYKIEGQKIFNNSAGLPYAQIVNLRIGNMEYQLINTHLASPAAAVENRDRFFELYEKNYQLRKQQLNEINDYAEQTKSKFSAQILVGDLNTPHVEPLYKNLKWEWSDSHSKGRGFGFNFPHTNRIKPMLRLDYVLARGKISFLDSEVMKGGGSDHLAVKVDCKL